MTPYRMLGAMFYIPRRKNELIDMIVKSGWQGTKTALRDMEHRQLKAILIRMRQAHFDKNMMRKPVEPLKTTAQVSDKTKEGV